MKKFFTIMLLFLLSSVITIVEARNVSIVLKDGNVVKGKLLGSGEKGLFVQSAEGKAKYYKPAVVEEVFDADTNENLTKQFLSVPSTTAPETTSSKKKVAPRVHKTSTTVYVQPNNNTDEPTPVPAQNISNPARISYDFKPGLGFGMGILSVGPTAKNQQIKDFWKRSVPSQATWQGFGVLYSIDVDLLYSPVRGIGFGPFGQWYMMSLGTTSTLTYSGGGYYYWGYDYIYYQPYYEKDVTFDLSFGAVAYGAKIHLKPSPKAPIAVDVFLGQLKLAGSGFMVTDGSGVIISESFTGSAPYTRVDLAFGLDNNPVITGAFVIGYQKAIVKEITYTVNEGGSGTGILKNVDGSRLEADFSGVRLGFMVQSKF